MEYLKINDVDFSMYVNKLKIGTEWNYKARVNASGNTTAKPIAKKHILEVGIIPLDIDTVNQLETELNKFQVSVTFLSPETKDLMTIQCMIPNHSKEFYTIRAGNTSLKAYSLAFTEL